eukprot:gene16464-biopygen12810
MPAPRPRHARATPAPPQAKKMPVARASCSPRQGLRVLCRVRRWSGAKWR